VQREVRRWVRLLAAVAAGQGKPSDLVLSSLVRARFGELLSPQVPTVNRLFLLALLSLIDAMLEMPMSEVLAKLPLDGETKAVLLGQPSTLRPVYQLLLAHESGGWESAAPLAASMHLNAKEVAALYWQRPSSGAERSQWEPERGDPRTLDSVLLCKSYGFVPLRGAARASTMKLFSFGPVPAQAFRASPSEAARRIR
jgi:hypothetical protein